MFLNGEAVVFRHEKTRELLAALTALRGAYATPGEVISRLWEDEPENQLTQARYRKAAMHLREDLAQYHLEDIVISEGGKRRLDTSLVRCDLFDYLSGKPEFEFPEIIDACRRIWGFIEIL